MGKNMHTVLLFKKEVDVNIYIYLFILEKMKKIRLLISWKKEQGWKLDFSEYVLFFKSTLEPYKYFTQLRNKLTKLTIK